MAGLIMDIFSSLPFGIFLVCFFLSAVISELLLFSFFTNRSFYSVMSLGIITTIIFNILFLVLSGIAYLTGMSEFYIGRGYLLELIYQILNVSIVLFLLFFVVNSFSKAFKPNFISS